MAERSTNHHEVNDIFRALKKLQKELSQEGITLTIIVANHTVKGYNPYKPISTSDAASSVEISQFSTGVIALAPAKDGKTMIKKVSSRNFPTDDTVLVVKMVKEPYQHFKYVKPVARLRLCQSRLRQVKLLLQVRLTMLDSLRKE